MSLSTKQSYTYKAQSTIQLYYYTNQKNTKYRCKLQIKPTQTHDNVASHDNTQPLCARPLVNHQRTEIQGRRLSLDITGWLDRRGTPRRTSITSVQLTTARGATELSSWKYLLKSIDLPTNEYPAQLLSSTANLLTNCLGQQSNTQNKRVKDRRLGTAANQGPLLSREHYIPTSTSIRK